MTIPKCQITTAFKVNKTKYYTFYHVAKKFKCSMFTSSTPVAIVPVSEALDGSSEFYEVIHKKNYKPSIKTMHQQVQ